MRNSTKTILSALALTAALPASAVVAPTTLTFNTTGTDGTLYGAMGNSKTFTTKIGNTSYGMRASAWSLGTNFAVTAAHLGIYGGGLGATNGSEDKGQNNEHTLDNWNGVDFITLQFDQAVTLTSLSLNAYNLFGNWTADTDATISHANTGQIWSNALNMSDSALLNALAGGLTSQAGTGSSGARSVNSALASGNLWLVSADMLGVDGNFDAFKLASVSVTLAPAVVPPAVPEPATWAMMLAGFGSVGFAMRRRSQRSLAQAI